MSVAGAADAVVLDAGALIALERGVRELWADLRELAGRDRSIIVPSAALAQVWRGTRRQAMLSRALDHCAIASFDEAAKEIGELCGKANISDVCDAQVAIVTARRADELWTSDPGGMRRLLVALGVRRAIAIMRC